jgi:hypothetical protein
MKNDYLERHIREVKALLAQHEKNLREAIQNNANDEKISIIQQVICELKEVLQKAESKKSH